MYFQHHYSSLQCHIIFRNHNNILICCLRNISDYYQCWKQSCCTIFLLKLINKNFQDSQMNSSKEYNSIYFKYKYFVTLWMSLYYKFNASRLLPLTITNLHPSRSLRSASERRLVVPSQRGSKSLSRTFSFTVPGRWNDLPPPHPDRWIPVNLQAPTENSSLSTLLDFIINKKK